jgi:hypothetical protein
MPGAEVPESFLNHPRGINDGDHAHCGRTADF